MIEPMKKVILLTLEDYKKETMTQLSQLGVMHIHNLGKKSEDLALAEEDQRHLEEALLTVDSAEIPVTTVMDKSPLFGLDLAKKINDCQNKIKEAYEQGNFLFQEREDLLPWGSFNLKEYRELEEELNTRLIKIHANEIESFRKREDVEVIFLGTPSKSTLWIPSLVIPTHKDFNWEEVNWTIFNPTRDFLEVEQEMKRWEEVAYNAEAEIRDYKKYKAEIQKSLDEQSYRVEFETTLAQGSFEDKVIYWEGFVPLDRLDSFKEAARKNGWAYSLSDPTEEDFVPTDLKLNFFTRMLRPLYILLGTFPGYKERDVSVPFLIFFLIFVAFLIGDAGYGLLYILFGSTLLICDRIRKKPVSDISLLSITVGAAITIWGSLTGTWFGGEIVGLIPPLKSLVVPAFTGETDDSKELLILIVLTIGYIQIMIAHTWNFFWKAKQKKLNAVSQLGWMFIITSVGWLVLNLVVNSEKYPINSYLLYMLIVGLCVVIIFGGQTEGVPFLKGILAGFGAIMETILGCIGAFSDILSYIRLFAVGLAGVAIADSFNSLGAGLFESGIAGIIGGVVIIILGHVMTIGLGMLSMIVHGVRLNLMEFSGHLGQEWSGQVYKPFGKKN